MANLVCLKPHSSKFSIIPFVLAKSIDPEALPRLSVSGSSGCWIVHYSWQSPKRRPVFFSAHWSQVPAILLALPGIRRLSPVIATDSVLFPLASTFKLLNLFFKNGRFKGKSFTDFSTFSHCKEIS